MVVSKTKEIGYKINELCSGGRNENISRCANLKKRIQAR